MERERWYTLFSASLVEWTKTDTSGRKNVRLTLDDRDRSQCGLDIRNAERDRECVLESATPLPESTPSPLDGFPVHGGKSRLPTVDQEASRSPHRPLHTRRTAARPRWRPLFLKRVKLLLSLDFALLFSLTFNCGSVVNLYIFYCCNFRCMC